MFALFKVATCQEPQPVKCLHLKFSQALVSLLACAPSETLGPLLFLHPDYEQIHLLHGGKSVFWQEKVSPYCPLCSYMTSARGDLLIYV